MKVILSLLLAAALSSLAHAADPPAGGFAPKTSFFTKVGTNKIHYTSVGQGPQTLVLVHGWAGSTHAWGSQMPLLQQKLRLILIDLPGHGQSDKPKTEYTMEFFARAVDAVLTDAKVDKAVFAGFSMGVPVISRFYRDHPEKVQALVTVDGSLRGFDISDEQWKQFIEPYRLAGYQEAAKKFISAMFPNPGTDEMRDRVLEDVAKTPQHVMVGAFEGLFDKASWELKKIDVPLLVVIAKSPFWTDDYEAFVRTLQPKAEYHVLEGTGHFLMLEKPDVFNEKLVGFLRKHSLIKP